ncbi:hypothetical protein FOA52_011751 [Chlamydomonas sp. UWO 241]|nr:hypothetical protein FOA52_011751 [Chlamydomonas sp. UWO 241]
MSHVQRGWRVGPAGGSVVSASLLSAKPASGGIGVVPRRGDVLRVLFTVTSDAVADTVVRYRCSLRCCANISTKTNIFDVLTDTEEAQRRALWPDFVAAKAAGKWAQFHRARLMIDGEQVDVRGANDARQGASLPVFLAKSVVHWLHSCADREHGLLGTGEAPRGTVVGKGLQVAGLHGHEVPRGDGPCREDPLRISAATGPMAQARMRRNLAHARAGSSTWDDIETGRESDAHATPTSNSPGAPMTGSPGAVEDGAEQQVGSVACDQVATRDQLGSTGESSDKVLPGSGLPLPPVTLKDQTNSAADPAAAPGSPRASADSPDDESVPDNPLAMHAHAAADVAQYGSAPRRDQAAWHTKDTFDKYGQIDPSTKMAMAPPKVTLYQLAFIAFKIENRLLFPGGDMGQRGETHAERSLAEMIELKGLVEAPHGAISGVDIISTELHAHPPQPPPNCADEMGTGVLSRDDRAPFALIKVDMRGVPKVDTEKQTFKASMDAKLCVYIPELRKEPFNFSGRAIGADFDGAIREPLELKHFPLDVQRLHTSYEFSLDEDSLGKDVSRADVIERLYNIHYFDESSVIVAESAVDNEWSLYQHTHDIYARPMSKDKLSVKVVLVVKRRPMFYILNVFVPVWCLVMFSFCSFVLPEEDLSNRLQVTLTMVLTLVAFKLSISTAKYVPITSYMTLMDWFMLTAFVMVALVAIQNLVAYVFGADHVDAGAAAGAASGAATLAALAADAANFYDETVAANTAAAAATAAAEAVAKVEEAAKGLPRLDTATAWLLVVVWNLMTAITWFKVRAAVWIGDRKERLEDEKLFSKEGYTRVMNLLTEEGAKGDRVIQDLWSNHGPAAGLALEAAASGLDTSSRMERLSKLAATVTATNMGNDHRYTLSSNHNLASVLYSQGKLVEAERLHARVLEARKLVLGPKHPDTLTSLNSLAHVLSKQPGKLVEAERLHACVLSARTKVLGAEHPDTLTSMDNLAIVLLHRGKLDEASALCQRALTGRQQTLGDEHADTLSSLKHLATVYSKMCKLVESEQLLRRALAVKQKVLGAEHEDTLSSFNKLAAVLSKQGKLDEAAQLLRRALMGREKALGDEHPDTMTSLNNLAEILSKQPDKLVESKQLYQRAVVRRQKVLGAEHPDTVMSKHQLGVLNFKHPKLESHGLRQRTQTFD